VIRRGEIPAAWEEARRALAERLGDIASALDKGFKAREQFREVKEVEVDITALPVDVAVTGSTSPLAVMVLRASVAGRSDLASLVLTTPAITWEWRSGVVRIHGIDNLAGADRFLVTLALVE
jgi:hypothetical protein